MNLSLRRVGGLSLSVWLLIVAVTTLIPEYECITVAEKKTIKKGILSGKEILIVMKEKKFQETLAKLAKDMGPYISALGPFAGFIMTFIPTEDSAELKEIKELYNEMDTRFEQVDNRLDEIVDKIDWVAASIQFGAMEKKILLLDKEYRLFVSSTAPVSNKKREFVTKFDNSYGGAGTSLYQAFVNEGSFTPNIPKAVMQYTENHRNETQTLLLAIQRLVMKALRIELNYFEVMNFTVITTEREELLKERQKKLISKYNETDKALITLYANQSLIDTKKFAADNKDLSNEQFSKKLYDLLSKKYDWRDWYVLIYNPLPKGMENQYANNCDGHTLLQYHEHSIMISSRDKETDEKMDIDRAKSEIRRGVCKELWPWNIYQIWVDDKMYTTMGSKERFWNMYYIIDKSFSCSLAVINSNSNPFYNAPENRVAEWKSNHCKVYMFMFG